AALEDAAEKNPRAARILGEAWLRGFMTGKPDVAKARECWLKAGEKGDAEAFILLARLHGGDFGFPELKDGAAEAGFYRDAAKAGDADAFVPLGAMLLETGRSGDEEREGREWLGKALERKDMSAWHVLGDREKKDGKGEAATLVYQNGAAAGDAGCMVRLAEGAPGTGERKEWLVKAAAVGSPVAAARLGRLMLEGGSAADLPLARRYLIQSAREGSWQAQYDLGMFYLEGRDGARDADAAVRWLTEAMKGGDPDVQYKLATLHQQGIGGPVNYANAGVLYTMACNKGHAAAPARIAEMALEGLGTSKDVAQAKAHAMLAVERGDASAQEILTKLEGALDPEQEAKAAKALVDLRAMAKAGVKAEGAPGQ
ncbi:MAG: sel1 repeat family protein, partial [Verrucomicrobiaceae bacterium]